MPNGALMARIPVSKQIHGLPGVCRAWAIDPTNLELLELLPLIEQSMKRP